jgi:hypothetical protein
MIKKWVEMDSAEFYAEIKTLNKEELHILYFQIAKNAVLYSDKKNNSRLELLVDYLAIDTKQEKQ